MNRDTRSELARIFDLTAADPVIDEPVLLRALDRTDSDTQSLLTGSFSAALVNALAFLKHVEAHRDELSPAMRQRMTDDALTLLEAIRNFQCEQCEAELALMQRDARALCQGCADKTEEV